MAKPALADFLTDFGAPVPASPVEGGTPVVAPEPVDQQIRRAVEAAESAVIARFEEEQNQLRSQLQDAHAAEMAKREATFFQDAVQLFEERLQAASEELAERTNAAVARILGAALTKQMENRALDDLAGTLRSILLDSNVVRLRVSGPETLHKALMARLSDRAQNVEFTPAESVDLTVNVNDNLYATRLEEWSAELAEVLA